MSRPICSLDRLKAGAFRVRLRVLLDLRRVCLVMLSFVSLGNGTTFEDQARR
ncbi:MAG: hypothetical protein JXA74_01500 [Anaerolineae bacterium]|nr:hypothetical protein [Anaerolineae bacterium]